MAARILVVDDEVQFERLVRQRLRKTIREKKYELVFAQNGVEALDIITADATIAMVLCDINMPRMDGLTFLNKLREVRPQVKTVVVSAYGDMKNIRTAMNLGAFDFVPKPIDFADLEATIEKTLREVEVVQQAARAENLAEQNVKLEELDQLKTRFFTNISHEFRTPLTVISGMAQQIDREPEKWLASGLQLINRNVDNLLNLVNQILDLRKLESGALQLHPVQSDIIPYIHYIFDSFNFLARAHDVALHYLNSEPELVMDYVPEKLLRILSNLLANAVKFTPAGGHVYLQVDKIGEQLQIRVKDSGVGIPAEQLPHIFDRFFQADNAASEFVPGTGIGLSLVKELVQLMDGRIQVESQEGRGATFTVTLPIKREAPQEKVAIPRAEEELPLAISGALAAPTEEIALEQEKDDDRPNLLLVEDNADVLRYLTSCLDSQYNLSTAPNGRLGIDRAVEEVPDLIVSDVMMPEKDGLELCQTLKADERTSHIPIVLLTAKADVESRISGWERGADAYLAKPFEREELLIRIEKLLEIRNLLQEHYRDLSEADPVESQEDEFVRKVRTAVEENIDDEDFGIHQLCRTVGMSRTQLHRKIKALTGRSTSHYIRAIRLKRARKLLSDTDLNISQIAYEVGFRDPKYFSRTFAEEFGMPPNAARN